MASSGRRTTGAVPAVSSVLVVLVALAAWWLQSGADDPLDHDSSAGEQPSTAAATPDPGAGTDPASGLPYVDLADLPPEAADVVDLIDEGGPFAYDKDGSTFGNYEGLLPDRPDGYYREYTVDTPGSEDRGARRIIGGAEGELYWTADHYESFEVIRR